MITVASECIRILSIGAASPDGVFHHSDQASDDSMARRSIEATPKAALSEQVSEERR